MTLPAQILDTVLVLCGIAVWAIVLLRRSAGNFHFKIPQSPQPGGVHITATHIALVLLVLLMTFGLAGELLRGITFSKMENIDKLTKGGLATSLAEIAVILTASVLIWKNHLLQGLFTPPAPGLKKPATPLRRIVKLISQAIVIYLAIFPLVNHLLNDLGLLFCQKILNIECERMHSALKLLESPYTGTLTTFIVILAATLLAPFAEELLFRGLLQNYLLKLIKKPTLAIAAAALIFMGVHIPMYHQFPALFALGAILGWSYYRSRTLAMPIAIHIIFNSTTLILWALGGR